MHLQSGWFRCIVEYAVTVKALNLSSWWLRVIVADRTWTEMSPQRAVKINTCPPCDLFVQIWSWKRTPWQRMKTRYIMCVFKRKVSRCHTSFLCVEKRGMTYKCSLLEWPAASFIHHKSLQVSPAVILGWLSSILLSVEQFSIFILLLAKGSFFPNIIVELKAIPLIRYVLVAFLTV